MFDTQGFLVKPLQSCENPCYDKSHNMDQSTYNVVHNMNMYQNYISPVNTFDNENNATSWVINVERRHNDEKEIENFLAEDNLPNIINDQRNVCKKSKIAMTKNRIASAYKLNKKLQTICSELKDHRNITEQEWQEKMSVCNTVKEELVKLLASIRDENFLNQLKKDLEKRKRKRLREKMKKEKFRTEKLLKIERRARLDAEIDSWIRKEEAVIEKEKQEKLLRKDADMILFDVRGKRSDARKYLGLLQELRNLRNIKANIARARGEHLSSTADETFNSIIVKLTEQWSILEREYSIEEQGLKLMLKTDNEERIEKQKRSIFDDWENVLFGKKVTSEGYNIDFANLIAIRTAWDKYISSDGDASAIPIGWVLPDKPSSAAWQKCLKEKVS